MADTQSKPEPPLVREGGARHDVRYSDPFAAFLDLMDVVEALCPRWPERTPSVGRDYRL